MKNVRSLWIWLTVVIVLSFVVLGYYGFEIYRKAPPVPARIVTTGIVPILWSPSCYATAASFVKHS